MFERFTESAISSLFFAQEEANKLGRNLVCPEFLLLGLLKQKEDVAELVLRKHGVSFLSARMEVERRLNGEPATADSGYRVGFSPSAKSLLRQLAQRAKVNNVKIGPLDLLLGLLEMANESVEPVGAVRLLTELNVDLTCLMTDLANFQELKSEQSADSQLIDSPLSGAEIVERLEDSAIKALMFAQRKAWEGKCEVVEVRHLILGLIHADSRIRQLFTDANYSYKDQSKNVKATNLERIDLLIAEIPFAPQVKNVLEFAGGLANRFGQHLVNPKHILIILISIEDIVQSEHLEDLVGNFEILRDYIENPGEVFSVNSAKQSYDSFVKNVDTLVSPFHPDDNAVVLRLKMKLWSAEAELCRRVEKEALRQVELCREALAEMLSNPSNDEDD